MATIERRVEQERGCGYRKKGGLYMVSGAMGSPCCKLPFELTVCPCCGEGIKQQRSFAWVSSQLFDGMRCTEGDSACPMNQNISTATGDGPKKVGLLWVGEKYYPTPADFIKEGVAQGISKRISTVPNEFEIGKTWVYLAHPKAIGPEWRAPAGTDDVKPYYKPGIFQAFKPTAIEYVVTGKETEEELARMEKRGITLVDVVRDIDQLEIEMQNRDIDSHVDQATDRHYEGQDTDIDGDQSF